MPIDYSNCGWILDCTRETQGAHDRNEKSSQGRFSITARIDILPALEVRGFRVGAREVLGSSGSVPASITERAARPLPNIDGSIYVTMRHESTSDTAT